MRREFSGGDRVPHALCLYGDDISCDTVRGVFLFHL